MAPAKVPKKPLKAIEKPLEKTITKSKKKKQKKNFHGFSTYVYKVLKTVTRLGIGTQSMKIMNDLLSDILENVANEAGKLVAHGKKTTLSSREIQTAIKLVIPGELGKHANIEATKAITSYYNSKAATEAKNH